MPEESGSLPDNGFGALFEKVTVMHSSDNWSATYEDVHAVLGPPKFSDGNAWAAWGELSLSDEVGGPPWCLLARTSDLDQTLERAVALRWQVGERSQGGHETRVVLVSPAGLTVIAYTPASGA